MTGSGFLRQNITNNFECYLCDYIAHSYLNATGEERRREAHGPSIAALSLATPWSVTCSYGCFSVSANRALFIPNRRFLSGAFIGFET
jgi:hypothetical protein